MHQKHPFRTRKGDTGFNPIQIPASKGDDGFRQPTQLAYRARLRCPWATAGPGQTTSQRPEPHVGTPGTAGVEGAGGMEGQAAVPVGGGGAWPGFEATRRAKLAARTARGRAAAHGHTKQPGPTTHHAAPGTPAEPHATTHGADSSRAAGPSGARNTSGATSNNTRRGRLAGGPPPTGASSSPAH